MSDDTMFERNARAWLEQGPTMAPQHAVDAALRSIATTPQQRTLRVPRGFLSMFAPLRLAGAAAIVALVLGGGYLLFARPPTVGPSPHPSVIQTPGPSPSLSPTPARTLDPSGPSPAIADLGAAIQTKWLPVGNTRPGPGASSGHGLWPGDGMVIDANSIRLPVYYADVFSQWVLTDANGTVGLTLDTLQTDLAHDRWQCSTGDAATYSMRLSADRQTLTIGALQEACPIRAQIMSGDWTRWPCPNPASVCEPELTPGLHTATFEGADPASFRPLLAGYSYSVPAGWSATGSSLTRRNDPTWTGISVDLDVAAASQNSECTDAIERGVGSSAPALATWLASVPGLITTRPVALNIGGYDGTFVDASVASGWVSPCPNTSDFTPDVTPVDRLVLTFTQGAGSGATSARSYLFGDGRARYILLDGGGGHNVLIAVFAPDQASFDDLVAAAMPVIETFQFTPEAQ